MKKICKVKKIFSIFLILYITNVTAQNLFPGLCGGLHSGVNPCKKCSDSQLAFVKAQKLPTAVATTSVSQVARSPSIRRNYQRIQNRVQVPNYQLRVNRPIHVEEKVVKYAAPVQEEVVNVNSNVKLVPRFHPVGDLCFKKKESRSGVASQIIETPVITPANPPKIECLVEAPSGTSSNSNLLFNTMTKNQVITDDITSRGFVEVSGVAPSRSRWRPINRRLNKLKGQTAVERTMETYAQPRFDVRRVGSIATNIIPPPVVRSNIMSSNVMVDNSMYSNINTYPRGPKIIGVTPMKSFIGMGYRPTMNSQVLSSVQSSYGTSNQGYAANCQENSGISFDAQENMYKGETYQPDDLGTADPVSVAIMYKKMMEPLQKRVIFEGTSSSSSVSEEKLSYGPKNTPVNDQVQVTIKEIPEEKLHIVEKPVVELKLEQSAASRSLEETVRPLPTYRDLGYTIKTPETQTVVDLPAVTLNSPQQSIVQVSNTLPQICIEQPSTTTVIKEEIVGVRPNYTPGQVILTNVEDNSAHQFVQQQNYGSNFDYINEQQKEKQIYQDYQMRSQDSTMVNNNQYMLLNKHSPHCVCTD